MGCRANQFESAIIKQNLNSNGFEESGDVKNSDFYILNSCSVTHKSDNEAFYLLRSAKHKNPKIITILTGCIAQIEKDNLLKNDFIDFVFGNDEKLNLYECIESGKKYLAKDVLNLDKFNQVSLSDTSKTRASLKIQDGCDNRCSYCIIWKARGKSRSAKPDFIIEQINNFAKSGFKEVMLTGIHIGQWGKDFGLSLIDLIKRIENETEIPRYRLGSLNPTEISEELLEILAKSEKFCPHFHLSLQSANDKTLRSMNRFYKTAEYLKQIDRINELFERPFIGSDVIAGFAGETDEDFEITKLNLLKSGLSQIHTFPYSQRPETIGAKMDFQVPDDVKNSRAQIIKDISKEKYLKFIQKNIGKTAEVLIEKHRDKKSGNLKGLTQNYISVQIISDRNDLHNTLQNAVITEFKNNLIFAKLI